MWSTSIKFVFNVLFYEAVLEFVEKIENILNIENTYYIKGMMPELAD